MNKKNQLISSAKAIQRDLEADAVPFGIGAYKMRLQLSQDMIPQYDVLDTPDTCIWY